MNSALSNNLSASIARVAPGFKLNGDEVSRRLLAILFPSAPAPVPISNILGLNPTQQKKFKQLYEEKNGKFNDDVIVDSAEAFLIYANQMSAKDYAARTLYEHMSEFVKPKPSNAAAAPIIAPKQEEEVNENCLIVMYKGKEYCVGETSMRVYRETSDGVGEFVGMVGLAEFDGMEIPVDEM